MTLITTLNSGDSGPVSRGVINTNFTNLNTDKAEVNSPTFTGTPTAPTPTANDNSTKIATTAYVDNVVFGDVACRVYAGGATSLSAGVVIAFDTESFDTHAFHNTVTNNSRITIPVGYAGKYIIGGSINTPNNNPGTIKILLNGTTSIAWGHTGGYSGSSGGSVSTIYDLAEGDYVELWGQQSHTADAGTGTNFWAYKIN